MLFSLTSGSGTLPVGEEMLRLRTYEKLQSLVHQGAVTRTVTGAVKKYKGVASRMVAVGAEMKSCAPNGTQDFRPKLPLRPDYRASGADLIVGSLDLVANFDVWTRASPFRQLTPVHR